MERLGENIRTGQRSPKPLVESKHSHCSGKDINLLVLGRRGVGKTGNALISLVVNVYSCTIIIGYMHL